MSTDPQLLPGGSGLGQSQPVDANNFDVEGEAYEPVEPPTYDEAFPPMESARTRGPNQAVSGRALSYARMAVKSSIVTQVWWMTCQRPLQGSMRLSFSTFYKNVLKK